MLKPATPAAATQPQPPGWSVSPAYHRDLPLPPRLSISRPGPARCQRSIPSYLLGKQIGGSTAAFEGDLQGARGRGPQGF